jgi:hypothetical protein
LELANAESPWIGDLVCEKTDVEVARILEEAFQIMLPNKPPRTIYSHNCGNRIRAKLVARHALPGEQ